MDDPDEWEEGPAPRGQDWEQKLTALERFLLIRGRDGEGVEREAGKEILFEIAADASRVQGELAVSFFERKRKRDGAWGKIRPARLRRADIASIEDPSESVLLELLFSLGAREALTRGWSMWGELKVGSATIPSSLNELIVPRLAKTGRLYWSADHPEGELPPPLAWDGPPYRLTLGLTNADAGKGTTLSASLQRGNEERSEAEVVILLRSGLVCFEDRIAGLENPGDAFWASILRETGPITAPEKDTGQLIERLLNLPVRPPIELPPALAIREVGPPDALQKALYVAKGDAGVVADVRPEEMLQSESEPAGDEDYGTNSPVGSHVLPSYGTHRPRNQREGGHGRED